MSDYGEDGTIPILETEKIITQHRHIDTSSLHRAIRDLCLDDVMMQVVALRFNVSKSHETVLFAIAKALSSSLMVCHTKIIDILTSCESTLEVVRNAIYHHTGVFYEEYKHLILGGKTVEKNAIISEDLITTGYRMNEIKLEPSIIKAFLSTSIDSNDSLVSTAGLTQISRSKTIKSLVPDSVFRKTYESLSPKQFDIYRGIINGGNMVHQIVGTVGSGKSFLGCLVFIKWLSDLYEYMVTNNISEPIVVYVFGRTLRSIHNTFCVTLCKILGQSIVKQPHIRSAFVDIGPIQIQLIGLDNSNSVESIRGANCILALVEETTCLRHADYIQILSRLRSNIGEYKPRIILTSNFSSKKTMAYKIHQQAMNGEEGVYSVVMNTSENPYINQDFMKRIESSIQKNSALYAMTVKGEFINSSEWTCVYKLMDHHITDNMVPYEGDVYRSRLVIGCDQGSVNPMVYVVVQHITYYDGSSLDKMQVIDCLYYPKFHIQKNTREQYDEDLIALINKYRNCDISIIYPHDAVEKYYYYQSLLKNFSNVEVYKAAPKSVHEGIQRITELLASDRLYIATSNKELIDEFYGYSYQTESNSEFDIDIKGEDKIIKKDDHCLDALRYAIDFIGI